MPFQSVVILSMPDVLKGVILHAMHTVSFLSMELMRMEVLFDTHCFLNIDRPSVLPWSCVVLLSFLCVLGFCLGMAMITFGIRINLGFVIRKKVNIKLILVEAVFFHFMKECV